MNIGKKYKIAIVANSTWNIYNFRLNVLEILINNDFDVYVISPIDKYIFYKEKFPDVKHVSLKNLDRDGTSFIKDFSLVRELIGIYKRIAPDLVLHYTVKPNIYGGIAAGWLKIPSIAVVTGLGYTFIHNGFIKRIANFLYKKSSKYHSKVIFENNDDRELFVKLGLIDKNKGISVKGCGVDTKYYAPSGVNIKHSKTIFTFIGRLLYDKGIVEFVEAAKITKSKYENTEFWLFGEIDKDNPAMVAEEDLMGWVRSKTIIYHGFKDDIRKYVEQSDCIVLPSYREGMSRTILEGLAMGKPIITTDTAGCKEAVDEGKNGFVVPVKEVNPLAVAMEKIISMPREKRVEMGKYGRQKSISEFDDKIIAKDILNIIFDVLN